MFQPIVISCPFGNWLGFEGCTSTLGTFTYARRGGLLYRAWRMALTLRYMRRAQGWINRLGLPNPGIGALRGLQEQGKVAGCIVSIFDVGHEDWIRCALSIITHPFKPLAVELNLSCPNVKLRGWKKYATASRVVQHLQEAKIPVIAKLAPLRWLNQAQAMYDVGVTMFHCCNTIPTPGGGISGKPLKQYSLWACEELRARWPSEIRIIGGGGVTSPEDVHEYLDAGAHHVAIGSYLLNPLNWRGVRRLVHAAVQHGSGAPSMHPHHQPEDKGNEQP